MLPFLKECRPETQVDVENILDCFSGADGGASFLALCSLIRHMDKQAVAGDEGAIKIIGIVNRFAKLIDVAKKVDIDV